MMALQLTLAQIPQAELVWKSAPPRWVIFLLVLAALLFVSVIYRREGRSLPRPGRLFLGSLRLLLLLALLLVYMNPAYETKASRFRKSAVIVLVDESLSMTLADAYSKAEMALLWKAMGHIDKDGKILKPAPKKLQRIAIVNRLLDPKFGSLLKELRQRNDIELYAFSDNVYPNIQPGKTRPQGQKTSIGDTLQMLLDQPRDRRIAAVVMLTDGQSNSDTVAPLEVGKTFADLKIPIYTVGVGSPVKPKDIVLLRLRAREKVLVGDKLTFHLELAHQGYGENKSVAVILEDLTAWVKTTGKGFRKRMKAGQVLPLERGGRLLGTRPIRLGRAGKVQHMRFVHIFKTDGVYFVRIKVLRQDGEETIRNNQLLVRVEVRDDRLRVLYIEGPPRWEWRSMRNWLIRDPKITANLYLTWADPDFPQEKSQDAPDLENWPPTRDELFKYHVVILGEVDPTHMGVGPGEARRFLKDLRAFVEKRGGGLILIAGEQFNPAAFESSQSMRALLPVRTRPEPGGIYTEAKRLVRTQRGIGHPIFQLKDDTDENIKAWEDKYVGHFFWFRRTRPVPGASVLAVHPDAKYVYKARSERAPEQLRHFPLFVLRNFGRGKVFFSATDDTWRWRFLRGDEYFRRFWAQVIRYVGAPSLFGESFHYKLTTNRREYEPGMRVQVTLEVLDREFNPAQDESWKVRSRNPAGEEQTIFLTALKGRPGSYSGVIYANYLGRWELSVDKNEQRGILEEARVNFDVRIPDIESRNPELNEPMLKKLAMQTEGAYFKAWQTAEIPPLIKKAKRRRASTLGRSRSAWDLKLVLALILGLMFIEWFVRKLFRLH